ncbi:rhomboid family intramembrane serine protease [Sediminibacterium ginsengisoli]|uniref:Membrane associated serine protease, rhomboid family n=1 Tax=Sediminibacterium ginsengisoli TaxID=413434 RepID=A0A1T4MME2_9BACT|nr:rhomboid family intramembrane serine protease [Sediminibacterium ginsengisoli]SJZ68041.1 Membrane associated serine protease, rhomboid family [Sediminibacterium ginsengisoli]
MNRDPYKRNRKVLLGQDNNSLVTLFAINSLVFVSLLFIKVAYDLTSAPDGQFQQQILHWFTLPADANVLLTKPWTLLTYMFSDFSFWQVLGNMLWLWLFGFILQDLSGNNKLIPVYLYGGLAGALVFLLTANLGGFAGNEMLGAGAAVMAVATATTIIAPQYRVLLMIGGGIPLWVIAAVFAIVDLAPLSRNLPVFTAHLAGIAMGFLFTWQLKKGRDWSMWMVNLANWFDDLFSPEKKHTKTESNRQFYKTDRPPYQKVANVTEQRLNIILDKINQVGYDQLTEEEREFLQKISREQH